MKFRVMFAAALLCVAASATEAKKYVPPSPVAAELPIEIYLPYHEIGIDKPPTNHNGGIAQMLLATAVDNVRAKRGEARIAQLRDWFIDYDFNKRFEETLRRKLATSGITPSPKYQVLDVALEREAMPRLMNDFANPGADAPLGRVMKIQGKWAMSYTLQKMYVRTTVFLVDRSKAANGKIKDKEVFWRAYAFEVPLGRTWGIDAETNSRRWQMVGQQEMLRLLDIALEQSTDMLVYDFSEEGRGMQAKRAGMRETSMFHGQTVEGRIFREEKDWYWSYTGTYDEPYMPRSIAGAWPLVAEARAPEPVEDADAAGSPK